MIKLRLFNWYPFNPNMGQKMQTNAVGVEVDAAFNAHFQVAGADAIAADNDGIHAAIALTDASQNIVTGITNPTVPKNIVIAGNAAGIVGNVIIEGKNYSGKVITETIALNGTTPVVGNKAFASVTKITLPVQTHAGTDTVSVGFGVKLGLPFLFSHNTLLFAFLNNVKEATAPTVTTSATAIELNTITLNSALNGSVVDAYFIV